MEVSLGKKRNSRHTKPHVRFPHSSTEHSLTYFSPRLDLKENDMNQK